MNQREAKRLACRYLSVEADKWLGSDWLETEDNAKIERAMEDLMHELRRRAGA